MFAFLFAGIDNWIQAAVIIVPLVIGVLGSLFKGGDAKKKAPAAGPARPAPPKRRAAPVDDEIARQLEQFRRGARRRQQGGAPAKPVADRAAGRADAQPVAQLVPKRQKAKPGRPEQAQPVQPRGTFAKQVERAAQAASEQARAEAKADRRVEDADDDIERHLHEVFDHRVGSLQHRATGTESEIDSIAEGSEATPRQAAAGNIAAMLRDPKSIRQAIILSTILERPGSRSI